MIIPDIPENESKRLETLYSLNILDTEPEERFDRVTRIAKKLFHVPIALVTLVGANRQWFKSKQGFDISETPREVSFCAHTILRNEMMLVEDATFDKRFSDNPLVIGPPNIRFYLGCPLIINNQFAVGALCIIDDKSRHFSAADQETMRDLAAMLESELDSMHLSTTDQLTSLTNRRGFLTVASHVFNLCQRNQRDMILLFFDLDKFRQINNTFGHSIGDEALKTFSKFLLENFRNSDVIARLGGDEFCILCSDLSENMIEKLLKRFNEALKNYNDSSQDYKINYSVGYIEYNKDEHKSISDMLVEADNKMYVLKRRGVN